MSSWHRCACVLFVVSSLAATARAQETTPSGTDWDSPTEWSGAPEEPAPKIDATADAESTEPKEPGRGDFDAGGQVRLPNGPDEMNQYATFNWIALDLQGRYFLLDSVSVYSEIPLAVIKPDQLGTGVDPRLIGGITLGLDIKAPETPFVSKDTEAALLLSGSYMREGAMLLSKRDYPLYAGDFKPGFTTGVIGRVKLSSLLDFSMAPVFVYQSGTAEALTAVQIPTSTIVKLGSLLQVSADLGIYTGDDFSFRGRNGGRISAGGSITLKIGPILAHAGAGAASLLTGGLYPTIGDSFYVDLNVKYAK